MGLNEVDVSGWAQTYEGGLHGYTLCLGLGSQQGGTAPFHIPCPLLTVAQAQAAWDEAQMQNSTPASLAAVLPGPAAAWLSNLGTVTVGSVTVDLQQAALYAAGLGPRPGAIHTGPHAPPY